LLEAQDPKNRQKLTIWAPTHNFIGLCLIFAAKAHIGNRKKNLLNSNTASTCPHNMANVGPLTAEIRWRVWDTPANVNRTGFLSWQRLLHGTLVVGVSQILRRLTEGATYLRQGGHHVGHWPTFYLTEGRRNRMTKSLEMRVFLLSLSGDSDMVTLCVVGTVGRTFVGLLTDC